MMSTISKISRLGGSLTLSIMAVGLAGAQAQAAIVGSTDNINTFNPPPNGASLFEGGTGSSNNFIFAFDEQQGVSVSNLSLDIIDITAGNLVDTASLLSPGFVASGEVSSHILHFEPRNNMRLTLGGTISFDEDIVGIMVLDEALDASDSVLGLSSVLYPPGVAQRGLGFGDVASNFNEFVQVVDSNTLSLEFTARNSIDQIRVITSSNAVVQEIPTLALLPGLIGMGIAALRKREQEADSTAG